VAVIGQDPINYSSFIFFIIIIINKMSEFGSSSVPSIAFQSSESTRQLQREQISVDLNNVLAMNAG
jgi:hypothetical protein